MNDPKDYLANVIGHSFEVEQLRRFVSKGNLPHALLFTGPEGTGKYFTALMLAWSLLNGSDDSSLDRYLLNGNHPDLHTASVIEGKKDIKKTTKKVEIDLVARIIKHGKDPKFIKLGERLEDLREKHEQGLITSIEFLKRLLELARDAAEAEREAVPAEEIDKGKAALTELFNSVKNPNTPLIVERIVNDIDAIVKIVSFAGWQNTSAGKQEVKKSLRQVIWVKYKIKDKDVFDKAYEYVEMYY